MMIKNVYLFLIGMVLISVTACKKSGSVVPKTGNDTVKTNPTGKDVPSGAADGVTFINNGKSVIFNLYAPGKKSVYLIGDFSDWLVKDANLMHKTPDGTRWWIQLDNLDPSKEYAYQYYIDLKVKVADPYSTKVLDPNGDNSIPNSVYPNLKPYPSGKTTGIVSAFQANAPTYSWTTTNFTPADPKNLVVYEMLVRDFVATHSYQTITDTLDYLSRLGINAIELMPVNEFEGNDSWGYNSNFMFALDKYYGTPNAYKAFIDACHARGIAVIQDIVLEDQFGSSPLVRMYANSDGSPTSDNPWMDPKILHPDGVGYQMNHQRAATQYFSKNVMKYWIQEYHIDGFRFDQAKGYTEVPSSDEGAWSQYDASRVALWKNYNAYMKSLNPKFYVILEMFAVDQEEAEYAANGMMCWNNMSSAGSQSSMGYATNPSWDFSRIFYDTFGFPSTSANGIINYFESHDEERMQYKNENFGNSSGTYSTKDLATGLKRDEMTTAFLFSSPGPKMLWQFGELGYDISIDQNGRLGDKPILWNYQNDANRKHLYNVYRKMINMKTKNAVFATSNFHYDLNSNVKFIQLLDASVNVEVVGNFAVTQQTATINFPSTGTYIDNLTGATLNVSNTAMSMTLAPGEYHVYSSAALTQ